MKSLRDVPPISRQSEILKVKTQEVKLITKQIGAMPGSMWQRSGLPKGKMREWEMSRLRHGEKPSGRDGKEHEGCGRRGE